MSTRLRLVASNDGRANSPESRSRDRVSGLAGKGGRALLPFLLWPLRALRYALYMTMMLLRIPIRLICNLLVLPLLAFAVFWGYVKGWTSQPALVLAGAGVALFVIAWLFDTLLLFISPERIYLDT